jgi:hypothetical protein
MKNNGIADFIKPTIITAQQYGTKVSVEIDHSDTDIDELFEAFQTICVGLGYHQSAWKNWIVDRADEYRETDNEELKEKLEAWKFEDDDNTLRHSYLKDSEGYESDEFSNDGGFDGKPQFEWGDEPEDDGDLFEGIEPNEALKKAAEKYKKKLK